LSCKRKRKGCCCKAICKRFIVKCQIGVNATDCISSMPNALKSNAKLNARIECSCARAWGKKKCYSYGVGCDATTVQVIIKTITATAITRTLVCKSRDCGDSIAFNCPCVAHQICKGVGKAYNQMNGGSANGNAFVD